MRYHYNDGGRSLAGYKGEAGDCACRAIAIAFDRAYAEVYAELNLLRASERKTKRRRSKSSARTGIRKLTLRRYLKSLGAVWVPTMGIGTGCTTHLCAAELPSGRLIVALSRHVVAVIDGVVHDTYEPSRARCVYGYWIVARIPQHREEEFNCSTFTKAE